MYRLQVSPKKSFTYVSRTDTIFATIHDRKVEEFTDEQRGLQLIVLAQKQEIVPLYLRSLYTAFMMRFAEPFKTLAVAMESISRVHVRYDKEAVKKILDDVFLNGLKPTFPAEYEELALEQEDPERKITRGTAKSIQTTVHATGDTTPPPTPPSSGNVEIPVRSSKRRKLVRRRDSECADAENENHDDLSTIMKQVAQLKAENQSLEKAVEEATARGLAKKDRLGRENQELKAILKRAKVGFSSDEDTE